MQHHEGDAVSDSFGSDSTYPEYARDRLRREGDQQHYVDAWVLDEE